MLTLIRLFHCLPDSAWATTNWAEMGHTLRYKSRGAGSGSLYTEHNFSYTEIRNQRHLIRSGEGAPLQAVGQHCGISRL